ncbi:MAG TPA: FKBP-type peptidyl-prolyl cis-trans isomerase [Flavitalea sp.]|nr:FKBP-type peptidyl-prolyl cis-trans isomerase [Flavitalea sp.]
MKKGIFSALLLILTIALSAQTKPASKKVATASKKSAATATAPVMKNALDSFSYALGLSMAGFYKEQGISDINTALVTKALKDIKTGKPLLDDAQINSCIVNFMQLKKGQAAAPNKLEGQSFLDSNKRQSGVITLPSGLQYKVIKEGTGSKPAAGDKVKVHYQGSLINGKIFDSSIQRGEPVTFGVSEVIPGWTEALQLMPVGSKWQLFIPSDLGYGDAGAGNDIKPGSTLLFDVELLEIVK